jgi:diadenosine tetraphosphate (Ap4A) HIT family hydrolase
MTLDRLWAAWRSTYVSGVATGAPSDRSVFTEILATSLPDDETHILWRGADCFAILNAYPYGSGHLMVMPYREVAALEDLTSAEHTELWSGVRDAVVALKAAYAPNGVNVGMNLGEAAGAGVPGHLHVHCLPRWAGDTSFMTSVAETRVLPESLDVSWQKLRVAWPVASK